jgi:hypothetical protein
VGDIKQIIVGSTNIDTSELKLKLKNDFTATENWLKTIWYHDSGIPHVKLFWMFVFNKKGPR